MKKIIIGILFFLVVLLNTGCIATINCVNRHNAKVDLNVMQLKIDRAENGNTESIVAVDVLQAGRFTKGYISAWKSDAGAMTAALGIDTTWMSLLAWGVKEGYDHITEDKDVIEIYITCEDETHHVTIEE